MATPSSILAWTEESGRLQSMGCKRVRHDLATNILSLKYLSIQNNKNIFCNTILLPKEKKSIMCLSRNFQKSVLLRNY